MAQGKRVVLIGGHGKVAMLAAPKLVDAGFRVDSVIRNPDHQDDVAATGADPVVLDIEEADVDALTDLFSGADAIVFSAGAGGGNPARTRAVDYQAALHTMQAARHADVKRYVMVSYVSSQIDVDRLDPDNSFHPYAKAKHDADAYLRDTDLDYTILGPGTLTMEPATGKVRLVDPATDSGDFATSRENVAEAITYVLANDAGIRQRYNFCDGDTPISEAFA